MVGCRFLGQETFLVYATRDQVEDAAQGAFAEVISGVDGSGRETFVGDFRGRQVVVIAHTPLSLAKEGATQIQIYTVGGGRELRESAKSWFLYELAGSSPRTEGKAGTGGGSGRAAIDGREEIRDSEVPRAQHGQGERGEQSAAQGANAESASKGAELAERGRRRVFDPGKGDMIERSDLIKRSQEEGWCISTAGCRDGYACGLPLHVHVTTSWTWRAIGQSTWWPESLSSKICGSEICKKDYIAGMRVLEQNMRDLGTMEVTPFRFIFTDMRDLEPVSESLLRELGF